MLQFMGLKRATELNSWSYTWIPLGKACEGKKGGFGAHRGFWENLATVHPSRAVVEGTGSGVECRLAGPVRIPRLQALRGVA